MRGFAQALELDRAMEIFHQMPHRDLVSWTVLLDGYTQSGNVKKAVEIFERMPERDSICWTVLCQVYAVLGDLIHAEELFHQIPEKTLVSWTAIIYAYAQNGHPMEALELFWGMDLEGVEPDEVTFIGVLTACSHAGRVEQAWDYFNSLPDDRGLAQLPEHYHCVIDALGRSGQLSEAQKFVRELPRKELAVAWTSLLDACRVHGDVERGAVAAKQLIDMEQDPEAQKTAPYLLLSNIYAAAQRPEDVIRIRQAMKADCLRSNRTGLSRLEH
ncbi:pentatricopeptide repeat-containing protein At2g13600-like [Selaginella moellendorffii]|uniref:pentatricopeptide repeat-containing protein At2g13600-like n=1 Tax=Selaginella moellendorffii TaxID=88036 RepID=UPI000D1CD672|nr:pentatricopeptide repeat-containing protein At2g13600-like [Selaginella moellendorffii]|eukprot:XP_024521137.1 pentatricopeptide repeat-containing protein At2g13600-like [Selaginella moellendorffii]